MFSDSTESGARRRPNAPSGTRTTVLLGTECRGHVNTGRVSVKVHVAVNVPVTSLVYITKLSLLQQLEIETVTSVQFYNLYCFMKTGSFDFCDPFIIEMKPFEKFSSESS